MIISLISILLRLMKGYLQNMNKIGENNRNLIHHASNHYYLSLQVILEGSIEKQCSGKNNNGCNPPQF